TENQSRKGIPLVKAAPHILPATSRREFLLRAGGGFGALALTYLLDLDGFPSDADKANTGNGDSAARQENASQPNRKVGDLVVHGRRAESFGFIRSETCVGQTSGQ